MRQQLRHRRYWEDLGSLDPLWAVLAHPDKRGGRWQREEFFRTGKAEIDALAGDFTDLGHPQSYDRALDFGCGVGRLTRALAAYFRLSVGVDISGPMLEHARAYNDDLPNCRFLLADDLGTFSDERFDLIYTNQVLQHLPATSSIERCLVELLRILRPTGLLVFQLPSFIPWRGRLQPRRRLYELLRAVGCSSTLLYQGLGLYPLSMRSLERDAVVGLLMSHGGRVLRIRDASSARFRDQFYYVTRPAS